MNKPIQVYLGLSILEISKIVMYDCQYNYVKPKFGQKAKKTFLQTLQKMLKQGLILQIMNKKDHYLEEKKKCCWINER